jgi:hypothetical protein
MYSNSPEPRSTITRLGDTALAGLGRGQHGHVVAAFSKAVYLKRAAGDLFWIVTPDAPMHRRAAQVNGSFPKCSAGLPYCVQSNVLMIGRAPAVELEHSGAWCAPRIDARLTVAPSELSRRVQAFFHDLDLASSAGFGGFIPQIMGLSGPDFPQRGSFRRDLVLERAEPRLLEAAQACLRNDPDALCANAVALIGLGTGLTPSGDDFVGGLLFCLKHLGETRLAAKLIEVVTRAEFLGSATNEISAAILLDLAAGHAVAPVHEIVNRLLMGETHERIHSSVSELTRIGHSTGWDLLAGVLTGLLAVRSPEGSVAVPRVMGRVAA